LCFHNLYFFVVNEYSMEKTQNYPTPFSGVGFSSTAKE